MKVKVAVICHFNNDSITDLLGIKRRREFAPWIFEFLQLFNSSDKYELHVIAPHYGVWGYKRIAFSHSTILHFFPDYRIRGLRFFNDLIREHTNFLLHRRQISRICKKINPSIIHLFGAENPYYGLSALDLIAKYPVVVTIQGIVNHVKETGRTVEFRKRAEIKVIGKVKHFGVRDQDMIQFILNHNVAPIFHYHEIPIKQVRMEISAAGNYDLIFFARLVKSKGIEDYISLVNTLKISRGAIKAAIVGTGESGYIEVLKQRVKELDISENVYWIGELESIDQVHKHVAGSKMVVLPTYADTIPGTILESFQLRIPVISYAVGGIPSLNQNRESLELIDKGDVNSLAECVLRLLDNIERRKFLADNGAETFNERWGSAQLFSQFDNMYSSILNVSS